MKTINRLVFIENRQSVIKIGIKLRRILKRAAITALKFEGIGDNAEINITLVDDSEIKELNSSHRNVNNVTDVLSFPFLEYDEPGIISDEMRHQNKNQDTGMLMLGDIVLNMKRAEEQALEFSHTIARELTYLIVHSVLHLMGYDHIEDEDKIIMRNREKIILKNMKIFK